MPKCEHGLTSAECYVCASPKRGAKPVWVKGELPPRYIARSPIQAEPVQEPVAVVRWNDIGHISWRSLVMLPDDTPLYTAPPQRPPLTDEEIDRTTDQQWGAANGQTVLYAAFRAYARAIERKVRGET